jgi:hypothetical protein
MNEGSFTKKIILNDDVIGEIFEHLGIQCRTCLKKFSHPNQIQISMQNSSSIYRYNIKNNCWYFCNKTYFSHF